MTPTTETAVRAALEQLVSALLAAVRAETTPAGPDRLLSIDEAADALGVGRTRLYAELQSGRLRSVKAGRRRLVPASAVGEFIDADGSST